VKWFYFVAAFCLVVIVAFAVMIDPWTRYLQWNQVRLWAGGYHRHHLHAKEGSFYYYLREGNPGRTPLLLLHGLGMSAEQWTDIMVHVEADRSICSLEFLGFGRSLDPEVPRSAYGIDLFSRQVDRMLQTLKWRKAILAGVSMGGWVALDYALQHKSRVAGLILMSPAGASADKNDPHLKQLIDIFNVQSPSDFRRLVNTYIRVKPIYLPDWVCQKALEKIEKSAYRSFFENIYSQRWPGERVRELTMPTAIIWGEMDRIFPFETALYLNASLQASKLFPMKNTGHDYFFEKNRETKKMFDRALDYVL